MAKKKQQSRELGQVGRDVANAQAAAQPASYARRYRYDPGTGMVVANQIEQSQALAARFPIEKDADGSMWGTIPQLATANTAMPNLWGGGGVMGLDAESIGLWDSVDMNRDGKTDIRKAIQYYKRDSVAGRCVNLLAELANSTLTVSCEKDDVSEFFLNWTKGSMPHSFRQEWFKEYFKTSWVITYKTLIDYIAKDYKDNKIPRPDDDGNIITRAIAAAKTKTDAVMEENRQRADRYRIAIHAWEQGKAMADQNLCSVERLDILQRAKASAQAEWLRNQIPGRYTLLDPMLIDIEGPREMPLLREPFLQISGELHYAITNPTPYTQSIVDSLPSEITEQIKRGRMKIWLSPNLCHMTFGDKAPYERYPTPLMKRAFPFIENKFELIAMDRATARAVKERILLVKLGTDEFPNFDPANIAKAQAIFNTPSKNLVLVWNHTIELEWIQPDLSTLLDGTKYEVCDSQTRTIFGLTKVLLGSGDASGNVSVLNFEGVKEIVDEAQEKFLEFWHKEVDMVRASLSISQKVQGSFDKLNLQDAMKFWSVLTQAVMNGVLDHQTAIETLKFHFPTIVARMKKMKKLKEEGLFMPIPSANNMGPGGTALPAKGGAPSAGGKKGGKPTASAGADNNASRKGKPTKIKAKAKVQPVDGQHAAIVVDLPELDADQVNDIVEQFGVNPEWVMTRASYEAKYGKIEMFTQWPELNPGEAYACLRESMKLAGRVDEASERAIASHKEKNAGKRGAYITDKVRGDLVEHATAEVIDGFLPKLVGEDGEAMVAHMRVTATSLRATDGELSERDARIAAAVICTKRFEKSRTQAAA